MGDLDGLHLSPTVSFALGDSIVTGQLSGSSGGHLGSSDRGRLGEFGHAEEYDTEGDATQDLHHAIGVLPSFDLEAVEDSQQGCH